MSLRRVSDPRVLHAMHYLLGQRQQGCLGDLQLLLITGLERVAHEAYEGVGLPKTSGKRSARTNK